MDVWMAAVVEYSGVLGVGLGWQLGLWQEKYAGANGYLRGFLLLIRSVQK